MATTREMHQAHVELGAGIYQLASLFNRRFRDDPVTLRAWASAVGTRTRHRREEVGPAEVQAPLSLPAPAAAERPAA